MARGKSHIFIDVQHGLCNRLRAMASAAAIASATGRELVVIWRPDPHCEARLPDLFDYPGAYLEDDSADYFRARCVRFYNDMEIEQGSDHGAIILAQGDVAGDIYIRSAYSLRCPLTTLEDEQPFLRGLRPSAEVLDMVDQIDHPADVAAHIRRASGPGFDHLPYESPDNWPAERHQELIDWRRKSDVSRFVKRLDALFDSGARHAFVAADLPETYSALRERYGAKLRYLPRDCFDRSPRQLQFALADLMLLTSAPRLLASNGSSFSDIAQRLTRPFHITEKSGIDF